MMRSHNEKLSNSRADVGDIVSSELQERYHLHFFPAANGRCHSRTHKKKKVKASHTRHRALGPELIPAYRQRQSARR